MNSPGQIGKQTVKFRNPNFFFQLCAGSHSFCDAIHSEDTNLFQIMKNPVPVVVGGPIEGKGDGEPSAPASVPLAPDPLIQNPKSKNAKSEVTTF